MPTDQPTVMTSPPPPGNPRAGVGMGMLLTITLLAAAAAVLAVLVVMRHNDSNATGATAGSSAAPIVHKHKAVPHVAKKTAAPATVAAATTTTAQQPVSAKVPALSGDMQSAIQAAHDAGLSASVRYVPSSQPRGTVVAQYPAAGATATAGSNVTINVSSGTGADQVSVPNTVGMTVDQAQGQLNAAGLHIVILKRAVTDQSQAGHVIAQSPGGGSQAPKGSRVVIYWGAFSK